ncbi:hypothetical protein J1605_022620 [Eschrichtius robustus]|uniref:Uncharacterized protein n=1 Tax=Eschrichtius robustus TaxID=9764 RepID=A0AB34HBP3_ESCRO|nr:hypothetical protein J1605_022620 [Eschrichtius robustus]
MQREGREARAGEEEGACQDIGAALGDSGSAERLFPCETFCALIPQPHKPHLCLRRRASLACLPGYFSDAWNTFDSLIVIGSIVDVALSEADVRSILRTFLKIQRLQRGEHRLPLAPLRSDPCPDREGLMRAELALPTWSVPSSSAGLRGCPGCVEPFAGTGGAWGGLPCCAGFLLHGANLALLPTCLAGKGLPRSAWLTPAGSYGPSWCPDSLYQITMMRSLYATTLGARLTVECRVAGQW